MLLKKILIVIGVMCTTNIIGTVLILHGYNKEYNDQVKIYDEEKIVDVEQENIVSGFEENLLLSEIQVEEKLQESTLTVDNVEKQSTNNTVFLNNVENEKNQNYKKEVSVQNNKKDEKNEFVEQTKLEPKQEIKKEDIYTFKRNDAEIHKMISIAKSIIKENKDNIFYNFNNIHNKSNVPLNNFAWNDTLPTDVVILDSKINLIMCRSLFITRKHLKIYIVLLIRYNKYYII